MKDISKNTRHV